MLPDDQDGSGETLTDDLGQFLTTLNELKAEGCTLLVVGDVSRRTFTRASEIMFGAQDERRHRLLGLSGAPDSSVADRLPDPDEMPYSLTETTHIVTHATPRSVTTASDPTTPPKLVGISETQVLDPELDGFENAVRNGIHALRKQAGRPTSSDVRVCLDSLGALFDYYDDEVVVRFLRSVDAALHKVGGMGHFVLPTPLGTDRAEAARDIADVVVELRSEDGYAEQRWHAPNRADPTEWLPL